MKEISDVTFCCIDSGLFLPGARRLAEKAKRVIWYNPDRRSFPSLKQGVIGDGFPDLENTLDFWPILDEIDCFVFFDIGNGGLQLHLEEIGKPVWGSRNGDSIEINRKKLLSLLESTGLEVPDHTIVTGLTELCEHLKDKEDQYIKISRYRGDMETTHWRNWKMDNGWLNWMAVNLGPLKEHLKFLVFPAIDTDLEIGCDTFFSNGSFPTKMISGIESKDSCYLGTVKERDQMPEAIQEILTAVTPFLSQNNYLNQISFEVRVKGDKAFYIDATQRAGQPSSASQQLLWKNFPEIIWAASNGENLEPETEETFSIECMISSKTGKDCWDVVELPKSLERHARFSNCAFIDGCYVFPPDEFHSGELGWLCATGNSPLETLETAKKLCDQLPDGLDASVEKMIDLIRECESAAEVGISISDNPMPQIEEVIS